VDYGQESDSDYEDKPSFKESLSDEDSEKVAKTPEDITLEKHHQEGLSIRDTIMRSKKSMPTVTKNPFPVLTFRIVNELYNIPGGDIMSLHISAVAIVPTKKFESLYEGRRVNRRTYPKMKLQPSEITIFERSTYVRHTLDAKSPLLSFYARKKIKQNKGRWPEEFNNCENLRELLCFSQINVTLQGISNISKATVYAQKRYSVFECRIGWQFVGVIYHDGEGMTVDMNLINDVVEQEGGGGESLKSTPVHNTIIG